MEAATTAPLWLSCRLLTNPGPLQGKLGREGLVAMVTSQEAVFITLSMFRGSSSSPDTALKQSKTELVAHRLLSVDVLFLAATLLLLTGCHSCRLAERPRQGIVPETGFDVNQNKQLLGSREGALPEDCKARGPGDLVR